MDSKEKKPLLSNNFDHMENYRKSSSTESSSDDENWSDGSSSSYYSDSDRFILFFIILTYILQVFNECINYISYIPEWDSFVQDDGELIYIVSKTKTDNTASDGSGLLLKNNETDVATLDRNGFTRQSVRRSSKGCLLNY